jgi:DNA-binding transcriptional LysR family regulator
MAYAERILGSLRRARVPGSELTDELSRHPAPGHQHHHCRATGCPHLLRASSALSAGASRGFRSVIPSSIESRVMERSLDVGLIEIITEQPDPRLSQSAGRGRAAVDRAPGSSAGQRRAPYAAEQLVCLSALHREPGNGISRSDRPVLSAAGIPFEDNVAAELGSLEAVKHMAAQGFGIAIAVPRPSARKSGGSPGGCSLAPRLTRRLWRSACSRTSSALAWSTPSCRFRRGNRPHVSY